VRPTRYRTWHFFNNSNTNEDIATKFEQEYVRCVRNEEECVCSVCLFCCNIFIGIRIIKEMPGSVASGTLCIRKTQEKLHCEKMFIVRFVQKAYKKPRGQSLDVLSVTASGTCHKSLTFWHQSFTFNSNKSPT
jgi:hypothetical protein